MNRDQLKKAVGMHVQVRPPATDRDGRIVDADWVLREVSDDRLVLAMLGHGYVATLGTDHVYSFVTNPGRDRNGVRFGFLQLHVQLLVSGSVVIVEPLPPPKALGTDAALHAARFSPLVLEYGGRTRYFSWAGKDPIHLIAREERPVQLGPISGPLTTALHALPDKHPRFCLETSVRGDVVYELAPDLRTKWQLRGGSNDGTGDQVLVLMPNR